MSLPLWNLLELKPPPTFTCRLKTSDIDLRKLSDICWDALTKLQNQRLLYNEAATLSRLIYRMKSMLRGDKGFKCMEKVNSCLRQYLALDLTSVFDNLFRSIPWERGEEIHCPTLQMLEHAMLRTQGFAALLCRIVHTCHEAGYFLNNRMNIGHNWQVALLSLGAISRIWAIAKHLLECCITWYAAMFPFLKVLQHNGPLWLPEDYIFPDDLRSWLSFPWIQDGTHCIARVSSSGSSALKDTDASLDINSGEENQLLQNYVNLPRLSGTSHPVAQLPRVQRLAEMTDVGESIPRNPLITHQVTPMSKTSKKKERRNRKKENSGVHREDDATLTARPSEKSTSLVSLNRGSELLTTPVQLHPESPGKKRKKAITQSEVTEEVENIEEVPNKKKKNQSLQAPDGNKKTLKKTCKIKKTVTALKTHTDIEEFIKQESTKRNITCCVDTAKWELLKKILFKLLSKIKKTKDQDRYQHLMVKMRKTLDISLL